MSRSFRRQTSVVERVVSDDDRDSFTYDSETYHSSEGQDSDEVVTRKVSSSHSRDDESVTSASESWSKENDPRSAFQHLDIPRLEGLHHGVEAYGMVAFRFAQVDQLKREARAELARVKKIYTTALQKLEYMHNLEAKRIAAYGEDIIPHVSPAATYYRDKHERSGYTPPRTDSEPRVVHIMREDGPAARNQYAKHTRSRR